MNMWDGVTSWASERASDVEWEGARERRTKNISFKERLRLNLLTFLNKYDEYEESKAVGVSTEDIHRSFR